MISPNQPASRSWLLPLLRVRVWVSELVHPSELQTTLFWAGVIGFLGAVSSIAFRHATWIVQRLFTHRKEFSGYVEAFSHLDTLHRFLVPAVGGLIAGMILVFGARLSRTKSSTDYMEAIVLGDGVVSFRSSLVKCFSALFSIATGASIGREGPLVQLSAMLASLVGRIRKMPTVRLRLLVACGAAAGIASAYNAPIGGALFVAEIILQSLAMESFGPLVFSSVVATLTVRQFLGGKPLYEIAVPAAVKLNSNWEIVLYFLLGIVTGFAGPLFLRFLRCCEHWLSKLPVPTYLRLAAGGLAVGALAITYPEVCGNGYSVVSNILHQHYLWTTLLMILVFKVLATGATFGSGAVGGVFTPTIFVGACLGYLFCLGAGQVWPGGPLVTSAFTLVGMGSFLTATTHAPIMAILMLFEMTLDYQMILPLMLACVVAHYVSRAFEPKSIYAESLKRKASGALATQLAALRVTDLMKKDPLAVNLRAPFLQIAGCFIGNRFSYLYVVDDSRGFKGVISLHDIKSYLNNPELADLVIANDLMREHFPTITPDASLSDALTVFAHHDGDRLPVIQNHDENRLVGSISKTDLLLALSDQAKHEG